MCILNDANGAVINPPNKREKDHFYIFKHVYQMEKHHPYYL